MGYSSSDSLDHHPGLPRPYRDSTGVVSTPKLSSISGAKTETSSIDASMRSSSSRDADRSGELSISNASDLETEWVEQDEPGVYITIRLLPSGKESSDESDSGELLLNYLIISSTDNVLI